MSDDERRELKVGELVSVRMDDGSLVVKRVKYEPWELGHGEWVIGLAGISGGYKLSRVESRITD